MSQASLLYATKRWLLEKYTYNNRSINETICDIMPDGRPAPGCGELFISVHPGGFRGNNSEILWAIHSINITVTLKTGRSTVDRVGTQDIIQKYMGVEEVAQKIIELIHMNYNLLLIADTFIDDPANKWVEPLRFANASPPRMVGSDWVHSPSGGSDTAVIQTISFSDAVRVQFADYQPVVDFISPLDGHTELISGTPEIDDGPPYTFQSGQ